MAVVRVRWSPGGPWRVMAQRTAPALPSLLFTSKSTLEVSELPGGKKRLKKTKYIPGKQ